MHAESQKVRGHFEAVLAIKDYPAHNSVSKAGVKALTKPLAKNMER